MSRYSDLYNSNVKSSSFIELTTKINLLNIGDLSQTDIVNETFRLKKVFSYLIEVLKSIDPELLPVAVWSPFPQYCVDANTYLTAFLSSNAIQHLQAANNSIDNLLNLFRPYMIQKGRTKSLMENIFVTTQQNLQSFIDNLTSKSDLTTAQLEQVLLKANQDSQLITQVKDNIQSVKIDLIGEDGDTGLLAAVAAAQNEILAMEADIESLHDKLLVGKDGELSVEKIIESSLESIRSRRSEIRKLKIEIEEEVKELQEFYIKVFGKLNDEDERAGGLSEEISTRLKQLRDLEFSNKLRYEALLEQIESLLPGATSAGLASAYSEMKLSYEKPIIIFGRLFYVAIGLLILVSVYSIFEVNAVNNIAQSTTDLAVTTATKESWDIFAKSMIKKLPLFGALIWFAFFVSKRRSESQRLQQEYAHKEALAKSYDSYKKQIEAIDSEDRELQKEFIEKMVEAIAFNASQTLDGNHGDKHPIQSLFDQLSDKIEGKISVTEFLDFFKRK